MTNKFGIFSNLTLTVTIKQFAFFVTSKYHWAKSNLEKVQVPLVWYIILRADILKNSTYYLLPLHMKLQEQKNPLCLSNLILNQEFDQFCIGKWNALKNYDHFILHVYALSKKRFILVEVDSSVSIMLWRYHKNSW